MSTEFEEAIELIGRSAMAGPVAIVFSDAGYIPILANWLRHASAVGFENVVICALDECVRHSQIDVPMCSIQYDGTLASLWLERTRLFSALCAQGIDFIHSDTDAVWMKNPVSYIESLEVNVAFSQGTVWPSDVAMLWGHVVCCGFFSVRAGPATARLFAACMVSARKFGDDQIAINRVLRDMNLRWNTDGCPGTRQSWNKQEFLTYDAHVCGMAGELSVAMLPHNSFPRLPYQYPQAYVSHPLTPKRTYAKILKLRELALWSD